MVLVIGCLACGSEDGDKCKPSGTWTLTESTMGGDCQPIGEAAQTFFLVSSGGTAQIRDADGGLVNCEGKVNDACSGTFVCTATYDVESEGEVVEETAEAAYTLTFDGDAVSGTLHATGSGGFSCTSDAAVIGSKN